MVPNLEDFAYVKYPRKGKCRDRAYHRIGMIPVKSLLDGGLPGDVCHEYCLDCGKRLRGSCFSPRNQPSDLSLTV